MENADPERERALHDLAERLFFELEKHGEHYSLSRKIGDRARRDNLTLDDVKDVVERWQLAGPHGG
jgi:hypothetical protein